MKEDIKKKLVVSAILFKNNVPVEEAKVIGAYIEKLESNWKELKDWLITYLQMIDDPDSYEEQTIEDLEEVLNKMEELEDWRMDNNGEDLLVRGIIKMFNKFDRVPQTYELYEMIEKLEQENKQLTEQLEKTKFDLEYQKENLKFSNDYATCLKEELEKNKLNHKQFKDLEKAQLLNSYQVEKLDKLQQENERLEDELKWYKQQCDDLEMQIGCMNNE